MTGISLTKFVVLDSLETWLLCGMSSVQILDTESADSYVHFMHLPFCLEVIPEPYH